MPRDAGEAVFSVARSAGWIAHALEEYDEPPLRFRGQGHYRGPRPPQPLPWTSSRGQRAVRGATSAIDALARRRLPATYRSSARKGIDGSTGPGRTLEI